MNTQKHIITILSAILTMLIIYPSIISIISTRSPVNTNYNAINRITYLTIAIISIFANLIIMFYSKALLFSYFRELTFSIMFVAAFFSLLKFINHTNFIKPTNHPFDTHKTNNNDLQGQFSVSSNALEGEFELREIELGGTEIKTVDLEIKKRD